MGKGNEVPVYSESMSNSNEDCLKQFVLYDGQRLMDGWRRKAVLDESVDRNKPGLKLVVRNWSGQNRGGRREGRGAGEQSVLWLIRSSAGPLLRSEFVMRIWAKCL